MNVDDASEFFISTGDVEFDDFTDAICPLPIPRVTSVYAYLSRNLGDHDHGGQDA